MVDEKIKQQVINNIKSKNFFNTKRISRQLKVEPRVVGRVFIEMEKEGLIKRYNRRQWRWEKT